MHVAQHATTIVEPLRIEVVAIVRDFLLRWRRVFDGLCFAPRVGGGLGLRRREILALRVLKTKRLDELVDLGLGQRRGGLADGCDDAVAVGGLASDRYLGLLALVDLDDLLRSRICFASVVSAGGRRQA